MDAFVIAWINGLIFFLISPVIPFDGNQNQVSNAIKTTCSDIKQSLVVEVYLFFHSNTKSPQDQELCLKFQSHFQTPRLFMVPKA
jgi:hypothetical protein